MSVLKPPDAKPPTGILLHKVYPAHERVTGKERGEWMKLTDEEAALVQRSRDELRDSKA